MDLTFYDASDEPIAYTDDGKHIYLFSGKPVGYLYRGSVWSYDGKHLGRFEYRWIRDNDDNVVFFTENTSGGPLKPLKQMKPLKALKELKPLKDLRELAPLRPINSLDWSSLSGHQFFS